MIVRLCRVARPSVEECPDGLFGKEVRVAAERPQTRGDETTVEVYAGLFVGGWDFGSLLILFFGLLEICIG